MLLLQKMIMFFLIMLIGYICRKIGVFKDTTGKTISSIVINIGNPALIIASGMNPERLENKGKLLFTLGVALIYFAIMLAVAELLPRLLHADREDYGAYQVMTLFSNIGFMGYPLLNGPVMAPVKVAVSSRINGTGRLVIYRTIAIMQEPTPIFTSCFQFIFF